jgi:phage terminase large subunit
VNQEAKMPKLGKRVHHSTYLDVPRHWLGERFLTEAEHLKQVNELAYRHEYLGEETGTGLEVFTNVILETITDEQIARFDRIRQGLDFGYAAHPACFERLHYDSTRRRLYLFAEVAGLNLSNRLLWMKIQKYNDVITVADSAEPKSIDELRSYGIRVTAAKKGPGSVEFGIKWLQDLEAIIIDPLRSPLAAKEFINYALETDRNGMVKDKFPDKDNHSIDAVRYALEDDMVGYNMHGVELLRGARIYG